MVTGEYPVPFTRKAIDLFVVRVFCFIFVLLFVASRLQLVPGVAISFALLCMQVGPNKIPRFPVFG
jgi:hypothetical protein